MKSTKNNNTFERERKIFAAVMLVLLACIVALFILEITGEFDKEEYQHQVEYPLANANVNWLQTFHEGAF